MNYRSVEVNGSDTGNISTSVTEKFIISDDWEIKHVYSASLNVESLFPVVAVVITETKMTEIKRMNRMSKRYPPNKRRPHNSMSIRQHII